MLAKFKEGDLFQNLLEVLFYVLLLEWVISSLRPIVFHLIDIENSYPQKSGSWKKRKLAGGQTTSVTHQSTTSILNVCGEWDEKKV